MKTNTLVVIVNYRTAGLVCDCLDSLAAERESDADFEVKVVDNNSGDGSVEKITRHIEQRGWNWVGLMARPVNDGFAAGNNAAVKAALNSPHPPAYFWLLNPDTIVRPGAYRGLLNFLEARPEVGIAGSRLEDPDGTPQRSAFRFPGMLSEFERATRSGPVSRLLSRWIVAPPVREEPHASQWLSGASILVRREVFWDTGLLDDKFFLYFEETEFFWRAQKAGWASYFVPASRVVHLVGQSTRIKEKKRVPRYLFDSRKRYFEKSYGRLYARLSDCSWLVGHLCWHLRRILQRRPNDDPPYLVRDFIAHMCS